MIGAAVLGEVVGADALRSVAAAHHGFAVAGDLGVLFGALRFVERRTQQSPGAFLVLRLRFVLGHFKLKTGWFVQQSPARLDFVDVLPARAAASAAAFFDVFW